MKLTTVGASTPMVSESKITRADAPRVLVYNWGGSDVRWELERRWRRHAPDAVDAASIAASSPWALPDGTSASMCSISLLSGTPIGRIVGAEALKFGGWQRLNAEYAKQFGIEAPGHWRSH